MNCTAVQIPCCICGTYILSNAANKCGACLASQHDLTSLIQQGKGGSGDIVVYQCRECRRYQRTSNEKSYQAMVPESPELLALCLKQIPALSPTAQPRLHLVDAHWIWTEPNNMRFKVHLTVRYQVDNVPVQQRVKVELKNQWKQCPDCNREYTNRTWHAVVQLRQFRAGDDSKTGLAVLEMAIAKHAEVRKHVLKIDATKNGLDFYFLTLTQAQAFCHYLQRVNPLRVKTTSKLVSTDVKSNVANLKHSLTAELVPLCRYDLVLLPKTLQKVKLAGRLVIVEKVSSFFTLMDASPPRYNNSSSNNNNNTQQENAQMTLSAETYYKNEKLFKVLVTANRFIRFVVLDVELCQTATTPAAAQDSTSNNDTHTLLYQGSTTLTVSKYALANALVARESDMGVNDTTFNVVTHLGHLIQAGDIVLGYDLETAIMGSDWEMEQSLSNNYVIPDVVLVKKVAGTTATSIKNQQTKQQQQQPTQPADAMAEDDDQDPGDTTATPTTTSFSKTTKKREKRRVRREGKKQMELEESAIRMGFLEANADTHVNTAFDRELAQDPDLAEELQQLESAFMAMTAEEEEQQQQANNDKKKIEEQPPPTEHHNKEEEEQAEKKNGHNDDNSEH